MPFKIPLTDKYNLIFTLKDGKVISEKLKKKRFIRRDRKEPNHHPEKKYGEKFLGNFTIEDYNNLPLKSKRKGKIARDKSNNILPKFVPVFCSPEDLDWYLKEIISKVNREWEERKK